MAKCSDLPSPLSRSVSVSSATKVLAQLFQKKSSLLVYITQCPSTRSHSRSPHGMRPFHSFHCPIVAHKDQSTVQARRCFWFSLNAALRPKGWKIIVQPRGGEYKERGGTSGWAACKSLSNGLKQRTLIESLISGVRNMSPQRFKPFQKLCVN